MTREDIIENFVRAVREVLSSIKLHVTNVIAEAHQVVLEAPGEARTRDGRGYENRYCIVLELQDGEVAAIHESMHSNLAKGSVI
jgi:ketosteroid isomerase-like protein